MALNVFEETIAFCKGQSLEENNSVLSFQDFPVSMPKS